MKRFNEMTDRELIDFCIMFLNGANISSEEDCQLYDQFKTEVAKRNTSTQADIAYLEDCL